MQTLIKLTVLLLGLQFSISPALAQLEDAKKKEIADQFSLCAAKVALLHELMRRQGQGRPEFAALSKSMAQEYYLHGAALIGEFEFTTLSHETLQLDGKKLQGVLATLDPGLLQAYEEESRTFVSTTCRDLVNQYHDELIPAIEEIKTGKPPAPL